MRYLAECFQEILDDGPGARTDANKALNLTAADQKGRKKSRSRRQKVLDWGYEVYDLAEQFKAGGVLRLMSVNTTHDLVNKGHNLIIVALVGKDKNLHIRIFDANGKRVVDKAENKLMSGDTLTTLKKQLNPLPDKSDLSLEQKQKIIQDATSIAGHPLNKTTRPVETAIASVAKKNYVSVDTMKDAYDEFKRLVKAAEDEAKSLAEAASTPGDTDLIPLE